MPDSSQAIINCCDGVVGWMKFGLMYNMMAMAMAQASIVRLYIKIDTLPHR